MEMPANGAPASLFGAFKSRWATVSADWAIHQGTEVILQQVV